MAHLLVIDTSTEACSVALSVDGDTTEVLEVIPRGHTQRIMPMINEVLAQAAVSLKQLDAIAFGRGPGAFTGLRIAAGVVQGLAYGANLPVIPVSTLASLAQSAVRESEAEYTIAAIDARMSEVYWALYKQDDGLATLIGKEQLTPPQRVTADDQHASVQWIGMGTGCAYQDQFQLKLKNSFVGRYPRARDMATLAQDLWARGCVVSAEHAIPVYLRDDVVHKPS
jgi:tRNA threonylcarbamoyladenosine biosynthesis protein TsaB